MKKGVLSIQRFNKGTFQTLQELEETAVRLNESKENLPKQRHQLAVLQERVKSLKTKRDLLKTQLQNSSWKVLRSSAVDEKGGKLCVAGGDWLHTPGLQKAVDDAIRVKADHMLTQTCRLTGCTVTSVTKGKQKQIRICWDTFTDGQYCEPYYMEVETPKGGQDGLKITCHSLPYFIPLNDLSEDLSNDFNMFVQHVRSYLNTFVCRRQQAFDLQNQYHQNLDGEVHTSVSFDNLTFDLKLTHQNESLVVSIGLVYDDLLSTLPSRVFVSVKDGELSRSTSKKLCNHIKGVMESNPLVSAVESLIS